MAEREVLIGVGIFGLAVMLADLLNDVRLGSIPSATIRGAGLLLLLSVLCVGFFLRRRLAVPVLFTEISNRDKSRSLFESFLRNTHLSKAGKALLRVSPLRREDLIIRLDRAKPSISSDPKDWEAAWSELLREWESEVDAKVAGATIAREGYCYHIYPHLVLPLAFSLGASADLRRSVVLYHREQDSRQERFYRVLDLTEPRSLFGERPSPAPFPEIIPDDLGSLPKAEKLILHLVISDRHPPDFNRHPDHNQAASAALFYNRALNPAEDWLPYVKSLVQHATPLISQYSLVDICLICPSAVAFALGMAFSRKTHITVCDWQNNRYIPVFALEEIERWRPFD